MCGGQGTRLETDVEKPLFEVGGEPMVDRVRRALAGSRIEEVHAVVSPHAPATREHLDGTLPLVETPGEGYVADLGVALERVEQPVLTVAADLPLLDPAVVDRILDAHGRAGGTGSMTVVVPAALTERLGVSADSVILAEDVPAAFEDRIEEGETEADEPADEFECDVTPAGVNVVADAQEDTMYLSYDTRLAVNVNRQSDAAVAEALRCE
jgi:adenosylcobinamide-phosphate guanylyltransferase